MHHVCMCVHEGKHSLKIISNEAIPLLFKQVILLDEWNHQSSPPFQTHLYNTASESRPVQQNFVRKKIIVEI